jgi:hypothetical protein
MTNILFSKKRRLIAILLALALALSFGAVFGGTQAYAATDDDFLYSYGYDFDEDELYPASTFVLDPNDPTVSYDEAYFIVSPGGGFDDESDATDVADDILAGIGSDIISGDGIEGAYIAWAGPFQDPGTGQWGVEVLVLLPENIDDDSFGTISVKVTNTAYEGASVKDPFTNVTIVRQPYEIVTSVSSINSTVARTNSSYAQLTLAKTLTPQTIAYNTFYEDYPDRNFPTAADGTYQPWYDNTYAAPAGQTTITNIHPTYWSGIGYLLDSITANGTIYANENIPNGLGWMYAVYRSDGQGRFDRVELSKYVGFDSFRLFPGDRIEWRYWYHDEYDNVFPTKK